MRPLHVVGFVGLAVSLLVVAYLSLRSSTRADAPALSSAAPALGDAPPPDVARNPGAARRHVEDQTCLAHCAAEERTCAATAEDTRRCAEARRACDVACR